MAFPRPEKAAGGRSARPANGFCGGGALITFLADTGAGRCAGKIGHLADRWSSLSRSASVPPEGEALFARDHGRTDGGSRFCAAAMGADAGARRRDRPCLP
jgi:hypothetical protein